MYAKSDINRKATARAHAPMAARPEPLKRQLKKAAMALMAAGGTSEFHSFDLLTDGRRLVIEVAVLPPVTRDCEGAQRTSPRTLAERV